MMKKIWNIITVTSFLYAVTAAGADITGMVSMLLVKLAAFDYAIGTGDIAVYVMGAPDVAEELNRLVGSRMGSGTLTAVEAGNGIPATEPSILFVGGNADVERALAYTREHGILSVASSKAFLKQGVTLGITMENDMPVVLLNLKGSREENRNWHPGIMKIAKTIF